MSKDTVSILITALLSSGIFLAVINTGIDFIFMFLSTLPLFLLGLSKGPRMSMKAGIFATISIALITANLSATSLFFLIFALPCWYICDATLRHYDIKFNPTTPLRLWYPIGLITLHLTTYACLLLAIITAIFATGEVNLPQQIAQIIRTEIITLNKIYAIELNIAPETLAFILCAFLVWMWCILLLGHAWFANNTLIRKNIAKRPTFSINPFPMSHWLLSLIGICALASLIGGQSMRFLGKSSLIILLLPYFIQGMAMLHLYIRNWYNKRFFLFIIYFTIIVLFWPILIIAGVGLWHHIKILNKHLSSNGS